MPDQPQPATDEQIEELKRMHSRTREPHPTLHDYGALDRAMARTLPALLARLAEAEKTKRQIEEAEEWQGDHQRGALKVYGLADEFPYGCDAIEHVAACLVHTRERLAEAEALWDHWRKTALEFEAERDALRQELEHMRVAAVTYARAAFPEASEERKRAFEAIGPVSPRRQLDGLRTK